MAEERQATFGPNAWLVDEMYDQYRADPSSVTESWRDFFADYRREADVPAEPEEATVRPAPTPSRPAPKAGAPVDNLRPLRGAAARLVSNMEASLAVPTATSARVVPARLLEVNRKVLNGHLARIGGNKVSFTHLIGHAVVRALDAVPAMRSIYAAGENGQGGVTVPPNVGLGLAIDVARTDGSRTLLVPCIPQADTLEFAAFHAAYEDVVRRVRSNKVGPDDFAGVTMTLTNPGTLGTVSSVPRLMPGQSVIVGVGALGWPAEYAGADPQVMAQLGISKVLTLTSTYDHRVIQGAESGLYLRRIEELLLGADGFYDEVFRSLGVPYESVRWRPDVNPLDQLMGNGGVQREKQVHVQTLTNMYRVRGHLIADLDPLSWKEPHTHPELDPATYGLTIWDLEREFFTDGVAGRSLMPLGELLGVLRDAYCRRIGVEYMHIQEPDQKQWIQQQVEGVHGELTNAEQLHILDRLNAAEAFERFLHTKYTGHKRFGLEGAESLIPLVDEILDLSASAGYHEAVLGMAHRGRLNVLANLVGKSFRQIFREFEGDLDPATTQGTGDVKYHLGAVGKFVGRSGVSLPVSLASNPSHLEAVDPVVEGMVRARQDLIDDPEAFSALALVIHGDAAFAGQGVVAETLNLSALRGYRVGGTIHVVVNNQLGFTTAPAEARSSMYPTDVAKTVQAPIFHVNGDDPEAVVRVARLAFGFRQRFHKDVVIDMVCYRRHGHNEGDDPSYTQPLMYKRIEARRSVRKLYTETLVRRGDISLDEAEKALDDFLGRMQVALEESRHSTPPAPSEAPDEAPPSLPRPLLSVETGVSAEVLDRVATAMDSPPPGFTVHPKLARTLQARRELYDVGEVDWSMAEALAFGSLLVEGTDVRLSGQDSRRGTFSQRHQVLVDYETGGEWLPLSGLSRGGGKLWMYDSLLSEYAALGFEYGYSTVHTDALVAWEAQFGDFANGAQIVIDQFITAGHGKWGQASGLVLLLPHGYEGQGPEHSSARIERFLTLCAGDNMQVVNATTAAQYFHLLRRQVRRSVRRPLIVLTPKSLLRARHARSPVDELTAGQFKEVLDDPGVADPSAVRRVILASGKVAYDAMAHRDEHGLPAAVVRVEQLYPWPEMLVMDTISRYPAAREVVWLQEEPENMGPWTFVHGRLHRLLRDDYSLRHVSRPESASPATGILTVHQREQADLLTGAFRDL
ncbi:MAG: multifunctional oxoglutarate decarboxylase/oxoglutarate dehydrogenase thiamine pyrophosphate-binding subunit/dihydrolipoyllysine-residue succinyltransferase subunit [Actinomycetota bacterium]|nr:multifunctional oxoglutarate decarboxylase/oxoglutarate dehydrogenase thiamine pyrophosphate-binding subunit/dihydrolipoyllysine-residue succinyltransferase subunit [Actinomycetota bacterium]